jgi:tetratricopeptide (TPR) repeat protein
MTDQIDAIKEQFVALHLKGQGRLDDAIEIYRKRLALEPDCARTRAQFAVTLSERGDAAEALREGRLAAESEPDNYAIRVIFVGLLLKHERWSEAFTECEELLRTWPDQLASHISEGDAYRGMGDLSSAIRSYERATELVQLPGPFDTLGQLYEQAGRLDDAIKVYGKLLEFAPRFRMGRLHLGNALAAAGRTVEARHEWRRLVEKSDWERQDLGQTEPILDEAGILAREKLERHTET